MFFLEIFLSIHFLIFTSAFLIRSSGLKNNPSFKLKLSRILFLGCILSPVLVHSLDPGKHTPLPKKAVFHTVQEQISQSLGKFGQSLDRMEAKASSMSETFPVNYDKVLLLFMALIVFLRSTRFCRDLKKLKFMLNTAIPYRQSGRLVIKISEHCHIPFSLRLLNKAYIVLPLSLLSSSQNIKIALAHEGQHHRNGDCLWVYLMEGIRIIFFGNPGLSRWQRIFSELQEFSCDETLIGQQRFSAHDYGRCLFTVVQTVSHYSRTSQQGFACTVGMALEKENILIQRRIGMLSQYQSKPEKPVLANILFISACLIFPVCTAWATMGTLTASQTRAINLSHLNPEIQAVATREIALAVRQYHAKSGVIAIRDMRKGKNQGNIIAFAEAGNADSNWKSRVFASGSLIKPFIAAAAIESGASKPSKLYDCPSPLHIGKQTFANYKATNKALSLTTAMVESVNTCMIQVAEDTGAKDIRQKLGEFGFDMKSWWQEDHSEKLELARASLGENIPVTLESLMNGYGILANKGQIFSTDESFVVSEKTANSVTKMLEGVVKNGTGKQAEIAQVAVAGKTGSVSIMDNNPGTLALFGGYLPADAPQYVMIVILEGGYTEVKGKKESSGGALAAPVFRKIAMQTLVKRSL